MKTHIFIFLILISILSCKQENLTYLSDSENSYYPLPVGSYWIYKTIEIDVLSGEILNTSDTYDTIKVLEDTVIANRVYSKFSDTNSTFSFGTISYFRRDSLGYIVDQNNNIFFSRNNYQDSLSSCAIGNIKSTKQLEPGFITVETTAEVFECLNIQEQVELLVGSPECKIVQLDNLFSKGIGKIIENSFIYWGGLESIKKFQRQLIDYHIAPR